MSPLIFARKTLQGLLILIAVGWALDLQRRLGLQLFTEQFLAVVAGLSFGIVFLQFAEETGHRALRWVGVLLAILSLGATIYVAWIYPTLSIRMAMRPLDAVVATAIIVGATFVSLRITAGWGIVVVVALFLGYALIGHMLPGGLQTRQLGFERVLLYLGADPNGILGVALRVGAAVVVPYILFGRLLTVFGGASFFTDLATALMGRYRGGEAKVAIGASALFGTISGSAVGNVVGTGVVTIPLMRRAGYSRTEAGAVEAVASTGGQLVPPVLGATAFLLAEFLALPYSTIVAASLLPGFLYFFALFLQVDLLAAKRGLKAVPADARPPLGATLREGWHFLVPFGALFWGLFYANMRAETAALFALAVLIVLGLLFGYKGVRPRLGEIIAGFIDTGSAAKEILIITAAAGIVIGVLGVTGTAFGLTYNLLGLAGGHLLPLLILAALINIVLGMGMPTVGIYVLLATLIAPSLTELGVVPIAAHMFILYFGLLSMVTPPVAIASFAAANIAEADPWRTSVLSIRMAWVAYIVPFLFVASPSLLMIGPPIAILHTFLTAVIGIYAVTSGIVATSGGTSGPRGGSRRSPPGSRR